MAGHKISANALKKARKAFEANEPRNLFYRAATELVDLALRGATSLTVAEALAVLLQTWNKAYYQYRKFDNVHFTDIENLLAENKLLITRYRPRTIDQLDDADGTTIENLFQSFERVLGPVGAAKALHLLAPNFFPLWDRAIAKAYNLELGRAGSNGERYWQFLSISRRQCLDVTRDNPNCGDPLKSIDEYNYCRYTKKWVL
jgi:hypothetical protein